ncbi:MAG TPA: acetate--CoA ligase family protein [Candidatus Lokiarchaeia archaeon]|nr:acetate--CoA ligase family protein [Candidatus Lokiarchaeia archaeon]
MSAADILQEAKASQRKVLTEFESKQVLADLGLPVTVQELVATQEECTAAAEKIGYPVVMKLMAEDIVHKSDAGAVQLNLKDEDAVVAAYDKLMAIEATGDKKISVQEMASKPITEIIIGLTTDPQFGPALMVGLGGVSVEVYKDVSFRICPITQFDAEEMLHEVKAFPLLDGFRGAPKADLNAIYEILLKVSQFAIDYPDVDSMDLNPVFTYEQGAKIVDARIILRD